jgi:hypothetical protein
MDALEGTTWARVIPVTQNDGTRTLYRFWKLDDRVTDTRGRRTDDRRAATPEAHRSEAERRGKRVHRQLAALPSMAKEELVRWLRAGGHHDFAAELLAGGDPHGFLGRP